MANPSYIGRFAPSPTGFLHFGSLVSALASYLDARKNAGHWLVRIEDLDPPREVPGATKVILKQLENHGLTWDGQILYQSNQLETYSEILQQLQHSNLTYHCRCSRQRLKSLKGVYDGSCALEELPENETAVRVRVAKSNIQFNDLIIGNYRQNITEEVGDFIIKRRDGLFSYQLAVVIDDEQQKINHVIRGADLLDSTPRQIYLQQCLGYTTPRYGHLPIAVNEQGEKLSKQNLAAELTKGNEVHNLI